MHKSGRSRISESIIWYLIKNTDNSTFIFTFRLKAMRFLRNQNISN